MNINQKGMTILEALIVIALIAIIVAISVPLTLEMIRRYKCENEIRTIYASWMEARQRALQSNTPYLINVGPNSVGVYEDRNQDGVADPLEKVIQLSQDTLYFPLVGTVDDTNGVPQDISPGGRTATADAKGLIQPDINIRIDNTQSPFNCITTSVTRIGLGKYDTTCRVQ